MPLLIIALLLMWGGLYGSSSSLTSDVLSFSALRKGSQINDSTLLQEFRTKGKFSEALIYAASLGNQQSIEELIGSGADVNYCGTYQNRSNSDPNMPGLPTLTLASFSCTPLELAVENGHRACVELLIKAKADINRPNTYGETPLIIALKKKHAACALQLLKAGANPHAKSNEGRTVISLASSIENAGTLVDDCMKAFINEVDSSGTTALHQAAGKGYLGSLLALLRNGADVTKRARDGSTSLHEAANNGHAACLAVLLEENLSMIDMQDDSLSTALHYAVSHAECLKILLSKGANPDIPDKDGNVPLYRALYEGNANSSLQAVMLLHEAGARCDLKNKCGLYPLHRAAELGLSQCVRYVVRTQEDFDRKDGSGRTVNDILNTLEGYYSTSTTPSGTVIANLVEGSNLIRKIKKDEFKKVRNELFGESQ